MNEKKIIIVWKWSEEENEYEVENTSSKVVVINQNHSPEKLIEKINSCISKNTELLLFIHDTDKIDKSKVNLDMDQFISLVWFKNKQGVLYSNNERKDCSIGLIDGNGFFKIYREKVDGKRRVTYKVLDENKIKEANFNSVWNYYTGLVIKKNLTHIINNLISIKFGFSGIASLKRQNKDNTAYIEKFKHKICHITADNNRVFTEINSKYNVTSILQVKEFSEKLDDMHKFLEKPETVSEDAFDNELRFNSLFSDLRSSLFKLKY